jgi:outer membrane protein assembly factor BamB
MSAPTLADHLRKATRHGSTRLPVEQVLALGRDLARELGRAHAETPPRHPSLDPAAIAYGEAGPRLDTGPAEGSVPEDLFLLGALLHGLLGQEPHVSWRLDGPPPAEVDGFRRRNVLAMLASPSRLAGFASAAEAAEALEAALAAEAAESPWSLFRGGTARAGVAAGGAPAPASLGPGWLARVGAVTASPVLTADMVVAVTADGRLLFLDRATGRRVHEIGLDAPVESSPAIAGGVLAVGTDSGELVLVDLARGEVRHRARLGSLVRSSPLIVEDRVVVGVVEGKAGGALVAVDTQSGKVVWTRKAGAVFSSPALWEERVLVGSDDGTLYAVEAATGAPAWSVPLGGKVRATPAIAEGVAVVGDFGGRLTAVRVDDGATAWTAAVGHAMYSSPCRLARGWVVGCHEGHLHGWQDSGAPAFEVPTHGPVISSAATLGDAFAVGSTDGALYLVAASGDVRQRLVLAKGGVSSSPAVDADVVYVGSAEGVHALRAGR